MSGASWSACELLRHTAGLATGFRGSAHEGGAIMQDQSSINQFQNGDATRLNSVDSPLPLPQIGACSGGEGIRTASLPLGEPPLPPDMLSLHWSEMSMAMRCLVQHHFVYRLGMRRPGNAFLAIGTGAHSAIEYYMRWKLAHEMATAPRDEVSDVARDSVAHRIETEGLTLDEDEAAKGIVRVKARAVDVAARMSLLHYDEIAPGIEPIEVEKEWRVNVKGANLVLAGRIDLIATDGIHDSKTAKAMPAANEADTSDQLTTYALAHRVLYGKLPAKLFLDKMVITEKEREDSSEPGRKKILETVRTDADLIPFLKRIEAIVRLIRSGMIMPCDRSHYLCSRKWCGFFDICPYVR